MKLRSYSGVSVVMLALTMSTTPALGNDISPAIQQNIDNLIRTNSCVGCDLRGADLNRMILSGADLSNADLSGANLYETDLSYPTPDGF